MSLRPSDIPPETVRELNRGERETANLAEALAMDPLELIGCVLPEAHAAAVAAVEPGDKITKLTAKLGLVLFETLGAGAYDRLRSHPSDTVRCWACFFPALRDDLDLAGRLDQIRPLADDPHFGVREWAWMALRGPIKAEIGLALDLFVPWAADSSRFVRRFGVEATRPRGVWCAHIPVLKDDPSPALPLLEPLRADPEKYVQDSVANWLNDAAKTRPDWVIELTDRWLAESGTPETARIVRRARRSL